MNTNKVPKSIPISALSAPLPRVFV